jgi:hypothetical protein
MMFGSIIEFVNMFTLCVVEKKTNFSFLKGDPEDETSFSKRNEILEYSLHRDVIDMMYNIGYSWDSNNFDL